MFEDEIFSDFWSHIEDLRKVLLQIFGVIGIGFILCLTFYQTLFQIFLSPSFGSFLSSDFLTEKIQLERIVNKSQNSLKVSVPTEAYVKPQEGITHIHQNDYMIEPGQFLNYERPIKSNQLVILNPIEGILISFKISFWMAIAITSPIWLYFLLKFIVPGLKRNERIILIPFTISSFFCALLGLLFAYYITIPFANFYLSAFNLEIGQNFWALSLYVDYTLILYFGHVIALELCLILFFLVHFRIISTETMIKKRRHMILLAFILGALLTPPDILTQLLLAFPLIAFYELAIIYGKRREKTSLLFSSNIN